MKNRNSLILRSGDEEWNIMTTTYLLQNDFYNCGPIACVALIDIFLPGTCQCEVNSSNCRSIVIERYKDLLKLYDKDLSVRSPTITVEIQDDSSDDERVDNGCTSPPDCPICLYPVKNASGGSIQMECCHTCLHIDCYLRWLENSGSLCVICRQGIEGFPQEVPLQEIEEEGKQAARKQAALKVKEKMEPAEVKLKEKGIKGSTKQVKEIEGIKAEGNKTEDLDEQESEEEEHVVGSQQILLRKQAVQH